MRARAAVVAGSVSIVVAVIVGALAWISLNDTRSSAAQTPPAAETPTTTAPSAAHRVHRVHRPTSEEPPADVDVPLKAAWDQAVALHKAGNSIEALTLLAPWRKARPDWFAEPSRAALLAEMERAALAQLARAVRSKSLEEARRLAAALGAAVTDPALQKKIADLLAAAERKAAAAKAGAEVIEHADVLADKQALTRHLQRFAGRGPAPKTKDWIDNQLAAVEASAAKLAVEPDPLAIPDPDEAEKRRLDQLEKLRQRNATGLLDSIDGALAWLALHQADDGHFGADATAARCKALAHDPACVAAGTKEQYALAATGLSVLAFLDFRDQDVKRLFEPTLSRGIAWIVAQQKPDGSFAPEAVPGWAKGYAWAIGLMALGQAATSTRDPALVDAVQRGIDFYAKHHGKMRGGYRYGLDGDGDLSVTGWYVQAMEAATNAGAKVPDDMKKNIDQFLEYVTRPGHHDFAYTPDTSVSPSLNAVGMLVMSILRPDSPQIFGDDWRAYLVNATPGKNTYALYYGVRVYLFLDGKVNDKWRKALADLATKQKTTTGAAGMIPLDDGGWFAAQRGVGPTIATAFAALTLEHSLYRR